MNLYLWWNLAQQGEIHPHGGRVPGREYVELNSLAWEIARKACGAQNSNASRGRKCINNQHYFQQGHRQKSPVYS
jgi:hypothetical protein